MPSYFVTQAGAGTHDGLSLANAYSVANFNALTGDYSGDTFYFSGTITTPVNVQIYGTNGNQVTLDGWEGGTSNPVVDGENTNCCLINTDGVADYGINVEGQSYITIQDFRFTNNLDDTTGIGVGWYGAIFVHYPDQGYATDIWCEGIVIRRNYIHDFSGRAVHLRQSRNSTFGGADGDGNYVWDCGVLRSETYGVEDRQQLTIFDCEHIVVSYNKMGNTASYQNYNNSQNLITTHMLRYALFEFNDMSNPQEDSCFSFKEGTSGGTHNNEFIIVRFNHCHDSPGANSYGVSPNWWSTDIYVYANLLEECRAGGVSPAKEAERVYIWANILNQNTLRGVYTTKRTATPAFGANDVYVFNNTFYKNGFGYTQAENTALYITDLKSGGGGLTAKNNIFVDNGGNANNNHVTNDWWTALATLDHNMYYDSSGTVTWRWDSAYRSLAYMQGLGTPQEANSSIENPLLNDPENGDFSLQATSPAIGNGTDLSSLNPNSVTIQGIEYPLNLAIAIDSENTDFTTTPPTVAVVDQSSNWSLGAIADTSIESSCTESTVICTNDTTNNGVSSDGSTYQEIQSFGAEKTICKIDLKPYQVVTGYMHVEVWNAAGTVQYGGDSDSVEITAASPGEVTSFEWTTNTPPTVPDADFRVYIIEASGALRIRCGADSCYGSSAYELFDAGSGTNLDAYMVIYTINETDVTPPVITLTGDNPQIVELDGTYTELGASAIDDVDGDITANIVIDATAVNPSLIGIYTVTYNVSDAAGNPAEEKTRTVAVRPVGGITIGPGGHFTTWPTTPLLPGDNLVIIADGTYTIDTGGYNGTEAEPITVTGGGFAVGTASSNHVFDGNWWVIEQLDLLGEYGVSGGNVWFRRHGSK